MSARRPDRQGAGSGARGAVRSGERPHGEVTPAGQRRDLDPRVQTARVRADRDRADRPRMVLADERERQRRRTVAVQVREGVKRPLGDGRVAPREHIHDVGRTGRQALALTQHPARHWAACRGTEARRRRGAWRRADRGRPVQEAGVDDVAAAACAGSGVLHRGQQARAGVLAGVDHVALHRGIRRDGLQQRALSRGRLEVGHAGAHQLERVDRLTVASFPAPLHRRRRTSSNVLTTA